MNELAVASTDELDRAGAKVTIAARRLQIERKIVARFGQLICGGKPRKVIERQSKMSLRQNESRGRMERRGR